MMDERLARTSARTVAGFGPDTLEKSKTTTREATHAMQYSYMMVSKAAVDFSPTRPPAENTAEKQRVRQQMLARNWHDDAISSELGSFCQKSHLIAGLIDLS